MLALGFRTRFNRRQHEVPESVRLDPACARLIICSRDEHYDYDVPIAGFHDVLPGEGYVPVFAKQEISMFKDSVRHGRWNTESVLPKSVSSRLGQIPGTVGIAL